MVVLVHWQAEEMEQHLQPSPPEAGSKELQLQPPVVCLFQLLKKGSFVIIKATQTWKHCL